MGRLQEAQKEAKNINLPRLSRGDLEGLDSLALRFILRRIHYHQDTQGAVGRALVRRVGFRGDYWNLLKAEKVDLIWHIRQQLVFVRDHYNSSDAHLECVAGGFFCLVSDGQPVLHYRLMPGELECTAVAQYLLDNNMAEMVAMRPVQRLSTVRGLECSLSNWELKIWGLTSEGSTSIVRRERTTNQPQQLQTIT